MNNPGARSETPVGRGYRRRKAVCLFGSVVGPHPTGSVRPPAVDRECALAKRSRLCYCTALPRHGHRTCHAQREEGGGDPADHCRASDLRSVAR